MTAEIISIGDELLLGDTVNTHAAWLGETLSGRGIEVRRVHTVGDDRKLLLECLRQALETAGLVITTGGLGPTHDDITKEAVAAYFGSSMQLHKPTLEFIRKVFEKRNIPFTRSNYHQAEVPERAEVLFNEQGTAPGLWFQAGEARLAVLPGVPHEMKHLFTHKVLPMLEEEKGASRPPVHYVAMAGIGESTLSDEVLGDLSPWLDDTLSLAFLPDVQGVCLRIRGRGGDPERSASAMQPLLEQVRRRAGAHIIGERERRVTLAEAVGGLLRDRGLSVASAESCTGGRICDSLTDVPGSSDYVRGGIVAYDNAIKTKLLEVDPAVLERNGAVSRETALAMARGAARALQSDIGISATGIAGPGGGTPEKPVGTVWIGFWSSDRHFAFRACFTDDRQINKERTVAVALDTVRREMSGVDSLPYGLKPEFA